MLLRGAVRAANPSVAVAAAYYFVSQAVVIRHPLADGVVFPPERDDRGRPVCRPACRHGLASGLTLQLSPLRRAKEPGVSAPAVLKDIYTPAVLAFQALAQGPAFGRTCGRCDFHRIPRAVVEDPGKR